MGPKVFGVLFIIVAIGVALYILRFDIFGGLKQLNVWLPSASYRGPSLPAQPTQPGYEYQAPATESNSTPQPQSGAQPTVNPSEIPSGFTINQLSPYFHKVRLGSVSAGSSWYVGRISLYASFSDSGTVDITGWLLKGNKGSQFIPSAVNLYDPSGLTSEGDILLKSGGVVNIYTSESTIGRNLRLNKCLGYLENSNKFTPQLPMNCPYIDRSEISSFTGACQDYIASLGSCRVPTANPPLPENDYACRAYLDTLNYRGCFNKHLGDTDFLSNEWWAWTGSRFLDERHDVLLLFDKNGLLVDRYEY